MSDLISRGAALDAIESYCSNCDNYSGVRCRACMIDYAIIAVDAVPVADAVPVTRCKDCVYVKDLMVVKDYREGAKWCMLHMHTVLLDDFCSNGERIEDE